ncbi:MAG: hypothetical protein AVDCRST_MAG59-3467, partial [uncultured Thermomicrobiales bacterium]
APQAREPPHHHRTHTRFNHGSPAGWDGGRQRPGMAPL